MGIQCTGGFADMTGGKSSIHKDKIKALVGGVLVGIKCTEVLRKATGGK